MITFDNFSAWITIGDKACEEYGVQTSEQTRTVTCWIASEEGKEYQINWMCDEFTAPVSSRVLVDGNSCGGMLLRAASDLPKGRRVQLTGMRTSHTTVARFTFSNLQTTDDDAFISTPDSPELGDIKITFRNSQPTMGSGLGPFLKAPAEKTFHETTKKCGSHQTRFQQPATTAYASVSRSKDYGPPVAVFCFKYRPLAILQANGNAPPPRPRSSPPTLPPPPPLSTRISTNKRLRPEHGSDEDVKPYVSKLKDEEDDTAELRNLRNRIAVIEAKKKQNGSTSRKKVKLEPKREPH
ncbi:hypothetical protein PM082_022623 [Marasmius tenuissimus]|nr:hypothetical protein PM082_022623 [Marasmius tenuissimus]